MINKTFLFFSVLVFWAVANAGPKTDLKDDAPLESKTTTSLFELKNKRGWKIEVPKGWIISSIAGDDALTDPIVSISSLSPKAKPANNVSSNEGSMSLMIHIDEKNKSSPVHEQITEAIKRRNDLSNAERTSLVFKNKIYEALVTYAMAEGKRVGIHWNLFSSCNNIDLFILLASNFSKEQLMKPLKEQSIPQPLKAMFETFTCK